MGEAATNMENVLDAEKGTVGLQLPNNFEEKFTKVENRRTLMASAALSFTEISAEDKTTIKNKVATEIKTWTKMPEKKDPSGYRQKMAVLYLYTALDTKNPNPDEEAVKLTFKTLHAEPPIAVSADGPEIAPNVLNDKKTAATAVLEGLYNTTSDGYDAATLTALATAKTDGTTKITAATTEAEITTAQTDATNAINALQLTALTTAQTTAKDKLTTATSPLKAEDYTPENWANIQKTKTEGETAITATANKTPALVVAAEIQAETTIGAIPTKTQEIKTNTDKIDKTQNVLTKIQDSPAFKNLPNSIQRQVNKILNLTKRDDKVDTKISESQKEVTSINNQITKIQTDSMNKGQELFSITKDITILKSKNINTKDLEQQQARLTTAIENNNAKILGLKNELVAPQARLERLQNRDERIEGKLGDKFKDIANVLQTEIDKRTAVIEQLDNQQVVTALTKEIATITEVKNNIQNLQDANATLAQLDNPVVPVNQTDVTTDVTTDVSVDQSDVIATK